MKTKYFLVIFVVLFLIFIGIWIVSPKVGERVEPNKGVDVSFNDENDELPTKLPDGFVRFKSITEAVVYRKENEDGTYTFYEYVGEDNFTYYDVNRPSYLVRTSFDKRIYQVKSENGTLREEYRAFDGSRWLVVSKDYNEIFNIPDNYYLVSTTANLYLVKDGEENFNYKLLTKIGEQYAWLSPTDTDDWIDTTIPDNYEKTEITNIYKGTIGDETVYRKVLSFNDSYKTIAVVSCDVNGNFT